MIGRHGLEMVSRGIAAVDALHSYGFPDAWAKPKLVLHDERRRLMEMLDRTSQESPTASPDHSRGIPIAPGSRADTLRLELKDIGVDRDLMGTVLEAIATGGAGFSVKAHFSLINDGNEKEEDGGGLSTGFLNVGGAGAGAAVGDASSSATSATGIGRARGLAAAVSQEITLDRDQPGTQDKGPSEERLVFGRAGAHAGILESMAGQDGSGRPVPEVNTTKYRTPRIIDSFIMGSVAADIKPLSSSLAWSVGGNAARSHDPPHPDDTGSGIGGSGTRECDKDSEHDDPRLVIGPEIKWDLGSSADADGTLVCRVLGALKEAGGAGLSVPELRISVRGARVGSDEMEEDDGESKAVMEKEDSVLMAGLGSALERGVAVCVCGAEDIRWVCSEGPYTL